MIFFPYYVSRKNESLVISTPFQMAKIAHENSILLNDFLHIAKLQGILPWRFSSFHFCVNTNPTLTNDTGMFGPMAVLSTTVMKYYFRIPFQCHIGKLDTCVVRYLAFGK